MIIRIYEPTGGGDWPAGSTAVRLGCPYDGLARELVSIYKFGHQRIATLLFAKRL